MRRLVTVSDRVGVRGVEKAAESRQMRQPLRFWLVPGETSAAELETALRAVVDEVGVGVATARVATKKGREVVECLIDRSAAQDPDLARAQFLKAARAIDGDCVLDL